MIDWNDLRYFLAVAETGSTLGAGKKLRVSQTTAARRIAALERELGLSLFERSQAGYALTPVGEALLDKAHAVNRAADEFAEAAAAQARDVSGTVKLTTIDIFAETILAPILNKLHQAFPAIRIEIDTSQEPRNLAAGEADIAIRSSSGPKGGGLVGRRIAEDHWTVYCSRGYADAHGLPQTIEAMADHAFVGGGGENFWRPYRQWLLENRLENAVAVHHGTGTGLLSAVRAGVGLAVLPSFFADHDADLIRCLPPRQDDDGSLWLLTHERLRHVPRIRAVLDFLALELRKIALADS
ncbi:LysR family transcriptional regulator [Parasphingopyxis lamellibrachiae]|uniref:LysR family transcriptional regulator n=1 Tax=Parasphingopyxis lamellibrachiae TaxID=680125 RepID=A0A3D9FHD8_9SPHN|nr:LysR family transcriptional regulator [Parasphingopyxis lamellibrachiae]RED17068.1 LysR family transcriptional regulator [Parasphingopyxis lamellibrachiae]